MNVKDAIALMAMNPAVGFPWEGTLVNLVNGFLPKESQLDPHTAEAAEIQTAIDSLDASTQTMVFESILGPAQPGRDVPKQLTDEQVKTGLTILNKLAVIVFCGVVLYIAAGIGDKNLLIEVFKLIFTALTGQEIPPSQ